MKSLEMFETSPGFYTVIVDERFADMLTKDEALGVVASALFGSGRPIFVRSYEERNAFERQYTGSNYKEPVALLKK